MIHLEAYQQHENLIVAKPPRDKQYVGRVYLMSPLVGGGGEISGAVQSLFKSCPDDSVLQFTLLTV